MKTPEKIPILSFFTGAGFLDIGFRSHFETIWRNEFNPSFARGFQHAWEAMTGSLDLSYVNTESIIDLGVRDILREAFPDTPRPEVFGVIGGPPCPDFSSGGKNAGADGERGRLSQVYVNRILEIQPSFFVFENVPGLLRTEKHRRFFDQLKAQLAVDYALNLRLLNALEFGVPQDRQRVFLIGFHRKWVRRNLGAKALRSDQMWFPWPTPRFPDAKTSYPWPDTTPFGDIPAKPTGIPDELMVNQWIWDDPILSTLPNSGEFLAPRSSKLDRIAEGDVKGKSFKRLHRWRYSPAAAYGNNEVHLHPVVPRRLSVREALRIQTVPDTFVLPRRMPITDKFKTIGNGVPVKLAAAIAAAIWKVLGGEGNV